VWLPLEVRLRSQAEEDVLREEELPLALWS
jgi:hypothetical protein